MILLEAAAVESRVAICLLKYPPAGEISQVGKLRQTDSDGKINIPEPPDFPVFTKPEPHNGT